MDLVTLTTVMAPGDLPTVTDAVAPAAALVISLATFVFTRMAENRSDKRIQKIDDRAAAKDTVDALATLNATLMADMHDLRERFSRLETQHDECERERNLLLEEIRVLRSATKP